MASYDIRPDKKYQFPSDLGIIEYNGTFIVVDPQTATWIVLENSNQISVLMYLKDGHSIQETLDNQQFEQSDISMVITQIEARRLCTKSVRSIADDKRTLHLYLTNKCNLCCPHCYMFSGREKENELTTGEVVSLINDYVMVTGGHRITISGGEPTIRTDFDLIVKTASDLGLEVNVLTNGSLFSEERIKELSNYISSVQISIDGFSEESNSKIRGKGHFSKALSTIDSFINYGIETSVAITPTLEMLKNSANEYVDFAKKLAAKYTNRPFRVKFAEGLSDGRTVITTDSSNEEYASIVKRINNQVYEEDFDLMTFVETMRNNIIQDNCMFGVFAVASNGDVYLCPEIGKLSPIANIRTSSFNDIYELSLSAERATNISKLNPCKDCIIRNICGGGCRIKEFPEITNLKSFESIDYSNITPRKCNLSIKEKFYDLMIRSNEYLFVPLDS